MFGLNTGMRKSEILNLRWEDIKAEGARVAGKDGKVRIVPLNTSAMAIYKKRQSMTQFAYKFTAQITTQLRQVNPGIFAKGILSPDNRFD